MNKKMEKALNEQINYEMYSAYLYLSMAGYFESIGLSGFAKWMHGQFQEEQFHAFKIFNFIVERGGRVKLSTVEAPPSDWDSPLVVFEDVCAHENKVTGYINALVDMAIEEKDHAANNLLQWFVGEQVEEEATVGEIHDKLKLIGSEGGGLFMMDKDLSARVFTPPTGEEA